MKSFIFLLGLIASLTHSAVFDRQGNKIPDRQAHSAPINWEFFRKENKEEISGIGVLGSPFLGDICTASLLDTGNSAGPAYLLTNGHCNVLDDRTFLEKGEIREDQWTSYHVTFNHYVENPIGSRKKYQLRKLTYLTESGTDVAIYEVEGSLKELAAEGIKPLKIRATPAKQGEVVKLVGIPLLYVAERDAFLHVSECKLLETVALKNGIFEAPKSVRHRCSSLPGHSGGPFLSAAGEIILLNSHGSDDYSRMDPDCSYETRPCEIVSGQKPVVREDLNYGQYVHGIAGCFNEEGLFDLSRSACGLPK